MTTLASPIRRKVLWDGSDPIVNYFGEANFGASPSEACWRIARLMFSGENNASLALEYADGNDNFDNVWEDRTSLTYT
jgi:hypothetical protein